MTPTRRLVTSAAAALALLGLNSGTVLAQTFPRKPLRDRDDGVPCSAPCPPDLA